jgi:hypothetical protein
MPIATYIKHARTTSRSLLDNATERSEVLRGELLFLAIDSFVSCQHGWLVVVWFRTFGVCGVGYV